MPDRCPDRRDLSTPDVLQLEIQVYCVFKKDGEFVEELKNAARLLLDRPVDH